MNDGSVLRRLVPREGADHPYRKSIDPLGESVGRLGADVVRRAALEGAGVSTPLRPEIWRDNRGFIPLTQAKAWITRTMGSGVRDGASGFRCKSEWAEQNQDRSVKDFLRLFLLLVLLLMGTGCGDDPSVGPSNCPIVPKPGQTVVCAP